MSADRPTHAYLKCKLKSNIPAAAAGGTAQKPPEAKVNGKASANTTNPAPPKGDDWTRFLAAVKHAGENPPFADVAERDKFLSYVKGLSKPT